MTFEERINAVRDQAKTEEETRDEKRAASPSWSTGRLSMPRCPRRCPHHFQGADSNRVPSGWIAISETYDVGSSTDY